MKTAVIVARGKQLYWAEPFAKGLQRHGWNVRISHQWAPCNLMVIWSVRNQHAIAAQRHAGGEVCIMERGYMGNRFEWTSVSFGGALNNRARFYGPFSDRTRFDKHFRHLMKPWRENRKGYGLIMGQVVNDMSLKNCGDIVTRYRQWLGHIKALGYRPVFRDHPLNRIAASGLPRLARGADLQTDLAGAAFSVCWNSNSSVDSILAGVPCIVFDEGAMAWDVAGHKWEFPPMPDREAWAAALAWKQWSYKEIESGYCFEMAGPGYVDTSPSRLVLARASENNGVVAF